MELRFRKRGSDGPVKTYRHIVANLDNPHLTDKPGLLRHLLEAEIAPVEEEPVRAIGGYVEIQPTIAVRIPGRDAHAEVPHAKT